MANRSTTLIHYWYSYFVTIKLTKTLGFADLENYWLDTVGNCLQKVMCDIGSKYPICITSDGERIIMKPMVSMWKLSTTPWMAMKLQENLKLKEI